MIKERNIKKDKPISIYGISCKLCYKHTSKLINGYSQLSSISRALGFKNNTHVQQSLHKYHHLINFSDVEAVVKWLFENNYDIIKLRNDKQNKVI